MMDLPKLHVFANYASFLQKLSGQTAKYRESNILEALPTSLRGPALTWLKEQAKFTSLNSFKTAISQAFRAASTSAASPDTIIINPSPPYHNCIECSAKFSSTSRLLTHARKGCSKAFTCKHCEKQFGSNNKLHMYVRLHHSKI